MSIPPCTAINTTAEDPYRSLGQDAPDQVILHIPNNILGLIGNFVATGSTRLEAGSNATSWTQICVRTHLIAHETGVTEIARQTTQEMDEAFLKIWGRVSERFNFNGNPPPNTLAEIKAWFNDPENAAQLNAVTELNLSSLELNVIPPQIAKFTQLRNLSLYNNQITDISVLKNLVQLQQLDLYLNQITDISALGHLTRLEFLNLALNQITDVSALESLVNLRWLGLADNRITDASALASLTMLKHLDLKDNPL